MASADGSGNSGELVEDAAAEFEDNAEGAEGGRQQDAEEWQEDVDEAATQPQEDGHFDPWAGAAQESVYPGGAPEPDTDNWDQTGDGAWDTWNNSDEGSQPSGQGSHQSRNDAQTGVRISNDRRGEDRDGNSLKPGDAPPTWDGKNPKDNIKQYLKMLNLWLKTTRTKKDCQGYVIFNVAKGELRELLASMMRTS